MTIDSKREKILRLLLRKYGVELTEARQNFDLCERVWSEAKAVTEEADATAQRSVSTQRSLMTRGGTINVAVAHSVGLDLAESWRHVSKSKDTEARCLRALDNARAEVSFRQSQIRRVEEAAERAANEQAFRLGIRTANEQDALWLGAKGRGTAA